MLLLHNIGHFTANVTQMCRMKSIFFVAKMMMHLVSFLYLIANSSFFTENKRTIKKVNKNMLKTADEYCYVTVLSMMDCCHISTKFLLAF